MLLITPRQLVHTRAIRAVSNRISNCLRTPSAGWSPFIISDSRHVHSLSTIICLPVMLSLNIVIMMYSHNNGDPWKTVATYRSIAVCPVKMTVWKSKRTFNISCTAHIYIAYIRNGSEEKQKEASREKESHRTSGHAVQLSVL